MCNSWVSEIVLCTDLEIHSFIHWGANWFRRLIQSVWLARVVAQRAKVDKTMHFVWIVCQHFYFYVLFIFSNMVQTAQMLLIKHCAAQCLIKGLCMIQVTRHKHCRYKQPVTNRSLSAVRLTTVFFCLDSIEAIIGTDYTQSKAARTGHSFRL